MVEFGREGFEGDEAEGGAVDAVAQAAAVGGAVLKHMAEVGVAEGAAHLHAVQDRKSVV